uniref:Uncharacterized protein n=1 Tax=Ananas comosus var. bracteatus TaxID=296719 RepID=A0A6V7PLM1_ANACO|nr:unnamed protein product [Ananas comosus var. bracteatus]
MARSLLQAGTAKIAIATYARSCGIGRRNGMPWGRLIPRVGIAFGIGGGTGSRQGCHAPSSANLVRFGHANRPPNGQSLPSIHPTRPRVNHPRNTVSSQARGEGRLTSTSALSPRDNRYNHRERRTIDPRDPKSLKLNGRGEPSNPLSSYRERRTVDPVESLPGEENRRSRSSDSIFANSTIPKDSETYFHNLRV